MIAGAEVHVEDGRHGVVIKEVWVETADGAFEGGVFATFAYSLLEKGLESSCLL